MMLEHDDGLNGCRGVVSSVLIMAAAFALLLVTVFCGGDLYRWVF